jgi:hypothetical protein
MRHFDFKIQTAFMGLFLWGIITALLYKFNFIAKSAHELSGFVALFALMPFGALQVFSCLYKIGKTPNNWRVLHLGFTALFFTAWATYIYFDPQETDLIVAGIYTLWVMPIVLGIGYYLLVFSEYKAAEAQEIL